MSAARPVIPGTTYMITRRCIFRQFLLTPCALVNEVMLYLLAAIANRHGVQVHGFCCMSSHIHVVCTDVEGKLPAFMTDFMSLSARAINAHLGRRGCFWDPAEKYDPLVLLGDDAQLENLAYVHTNPVSAGLVDKHDDWPGAATPPCLDGSYTMRLRRPSHFFRDKTLPDETVLRITPPADLGAREKDELGRTLSGRIEEIEREKSEEMRREGRSFVGRETILRQSPTQTAQREEEPFERKPLVKCRDPKLRKAYLEMRRQWQGRYREAYGRVRDGETEVFFPYGTWWWIQFGNGKVAPESKRGPG